MFNYYSFVAAHSGINKFERVVATIILILQFCVVIFFGLLYTQISSDRLKKLSHAIGNLYSNIDTESKIKLSYGLLFYAQRTLVSLVIAYCSDFSVQTVLIQVIMVLNLAFLVHIRPFKDRRDSWQEILNCVIVLFTVVLIMPLSAWTQSLETRYYLGLYFNAVIAFGFVVNFGAVIV